MTEQRRVRRTPQGGRRAAVRRVCFVAAASSFFFGPARAELSESVRVRAELLAFQTYNEPARSPANPDNILGLPGYVAGLEARPDFGFDGWRVQLTAKPRGQISRRCPLEGSQRGRWKTADSLFLNEGRVQIRVADPLFVSYGRENVQWGPSHLLSPSNPFYTVNGQSTPRQEEPGLDYGRIVWIPGYRWAMSLIANTGAGQWKNSGSFSRRYAVKFDHTGDREYLSAIVSALEDKSALEHNRDLRVGVFGGRVVSDPVLLHFEGSVLENPNDVDLLAGCTYTLSGGTSLDVEYFHQGTGLRSVSSILGSIPSSGLPAANPGLLRRRYILLQASHPQAWDRIQLSGRWVLNVDDGSQRMVGFGECELGLRAKVFLIGAVERGGDGDEFGGIVSKGITVGFSLVY